MCETVCWWCKFSNHVLFEYKRNIHTNIKGSHLPHYSISFASTPITLTRVKNGNHWTVVSQTRDSLAVVSYVWKFVIFCVVWCHKEFVFIPWYSKTACSQKKCAFGFGAGVRPLQNIHLVKPQARNLWVRLYRFGNQSKQRGVQTFHEQDHRNGFCGRLHCMSHEII